MNVTWYGDRCRLGAVKSCGTFHTLCSEDNKSVNCVIVEYVA